jgi:hypothetical protein
VQEVEDTMGIGQQLGDMLWSKKSIVREGQAPDYDWNNADIAGSESRDARYRQNELGNMLMEQAAGRGPSVAQNQLRQAQAQQVAQQQSSAASAQGGAMNRAMAQKNAADLGAQIGQQTSGQAATLRAQEQLGAMGQAGNLWGGIRQQDLAKMGLEQERQLGIGGQAVQVQGGNQAADLQNYQLKSEMLTGLAGAGAGVAGAAGSDERVKHDVEPASEHEMSALMEHLTPKKFRYDAEGRDGPVRIGVTTQDLERDPLGRSVMVRDEQGVGGIEQGPALGLVLAAIGQLYSELEGLKRSK